MTLCKKYNLEFIFHLKPDRLKEVNSAFEGNIKLENQTSHKIIFYLLKSNIKIIFLMYLNILNVKRKKKLFFRYLSNLDVNDNNIIEIVNLDRKRWNF